MLLIFIAIIGLICPNIYSSEHEYAAAAAVQTREQKGIIFVIEGVSGSGKTTMANELMKHLDPQKFIQQSLDDNAIVDESDSETEEEAQEDEESENESGFESEKAEEAEKAVKPQTKAKAQEEKISKNDSDSESEAEKEASASSQEKEKSQASESSKFEHSGDEVEEGDENKTMIAPLQTLAYKGLNVIYDTVISPEYIEAFIENLKEDGYQVYTIHVYCSPGELAKRTASRNSSAATPDEARSPFQPFANFPERYTRSTEDDGSPNELLMSPRHELGAVKSLLEQEYQKASGERAKLNPQEVERTLSGICSIGITGQEEEARLTPKYDYDLVVDNSKPQKAFAAVRSFILEKLQEN